jgi:hypothetical protein
MKIMAKEHPDKFVMVAAALPLGRLSDEISLSAAEKARFQAFRHSQSRLRIEPIAIPKLV